MNHHRNTSIKPIVIITLIFTVLTSLLIVFYKPNNLSWTQFIPSLVNTLYVPHFNIFLIPGFNHTNFLLIIYLSFFLTTIVLFLIAKLDWLKSLTFGTTIRRLGFIVLILFLFLQQGARFNYIQSEYKYFHHKNPEERKEMIFGPTYRFIEQCRIKVKGRHQAKLITTQDLNIDPLITWHRITAYYLYPEISIRFDNKTPQDLAVLFFDQDAMPLFLKEYEPIVYDKRFLILGEKR